MLSLTLVLIAELLASPTMSMDGNNNSVDSLNYVSPPLDYTFANSFDEQESHGWDPNQWTSQPTNYAYNDQSQSSSSQGNFNQDFDQIFGGLGSLDGMKLSPYPQSFGTESLHIPSHALQRSSTWGGFNSPAIHNLHVPHGHENYIDLTTDEQGSHGGQLSSSQDLQTVQISTPWTLPTSNRKIKEKKKKTKSKAQMMTEEERMRTDRHHAALQQYLEIVAKENLSHHTQPGLTTQFNQNSTELDIENLLSFDHNKIKTATMRLLNQPVMRRPSMKDLIDPMTGLPRNSNNLILEPTRQIHYDDPLDPYSLQKYNEIAYDACSEWTRSVSPEVFDSVLNKIFQLRRVTVLQRDGTKAQFCRYILATKSTKEIVDALYTKNRVQIDWAMKQLFGDGTKGAVSVVKDKVL